MKTLAILFMSLAAHATPAGSSDAAATASREVVQEADAGGRAVYLIYYWRAKPGQFAAYSDYITSVAEIIDEEGRKAGVFEWVKTYTQAIRTGAPGTDWTHIRIFRLENFASWDSFSAGLDAAALRAFPNEAERKKLMSPGPGMRDLLRQEIWRDFP